MWSDAKQSKQKEIVKAYTVDSCRPSANKAGGIQTKKEAKYRQKRGQIQTKKEAKYKQIRTNTKKVDKICKAGYIQTKQANYKEHMPSTNQACKVQAEATDINSTVN